MVGMTAERRRELLLRFMARRGLKVKPWCDKANVSANSLYNFLKGRSESISQPTLEKLAAAARVEPWQIFNGSQSNNISGIIRVRVRAAVQAGVWLEAMEWVETEQYEISIPSPETYGEKAFGLLVRGDSMNQEYTEGTILICVSIFDLDNSGDGIKNGDHVIVERHSRDGLREATCKELVIEESGKAWLWPRSTAPEHQQPIEVPWPNDHENASHDVVISAVVVGSYRPRKR